MKEYCLKPKKVKEAVSWVALVRMVGPHWIGTRNNFVGQAPIAAKAEMNEQFNTIIDWD